MSDESKIGRQTELGVPDWVNKLPKEERKALLDQAQACVRAIKTINMSGAGLLMDKQLREFCYEYNSRLMKDGPESLPSSYNWISPFLTFDKGFSIFRLLPEQDHLFSFSDFIDFATLEGASLDPYEAAALLPADTICSFNSYEDPHDLRFSSDGTDYAVGGVSLVRRGREVTIVLVGGEVADLAATTAEVLLMTLSPVAGKAHIQPAPERIRRAEPLQGASDIWKLLATVRVNIDTRATLVRSVMHDIGTSYNNITDDPAILAQIEESKYGEQPAAQYEERLARFQVLFEMAKTATLLPSYFKFKYTLVRDEKVATPLGKIFDKPPSPGAKREAQSVPPRERVLFRKVTALRIVRPDSTPVARRFQAPEYRVEVEGFWRMVAPDAIGRGPNGEAVEGRTWVRGHLRWRDRPARPLQVLVKSRVALARAIQEGDQLAAAVRASASVAEEPPPAPLPPSADQPASDAPRVSREEAYKERKRLTSRVRYEILKRDDFRCQRCGADGASDRNVRLDVDHKKPVVRGGKSDPDNLWTLCSLCNNGKGAVL